MDEIKKTKERLCDNNMKLINNEFVLTVKQKEEGWEGFSSSFFIPFCFIFYIILICVHFSYSFLFTLLIWYYKQGPENISKMM